MFSSRLLEFVLRNQHDFSCNRYLTLTDWTGLLQQIRVCTARRARYTTRPIEYQIPMDSERDGCHGTQAAIFV